MIEGEIRMDYKSIGYRIKIAREQKHLTQEQLSEIIDISPYAKVGKLVPDRGTTQQRVISFKIRAAGLREVEETIRLIQER
jgi:hypothetical protein